MIKLFLWGSAYFLVVLVPAWYQWHAKISNEKIIVSVGYLVGSKSVTKNNWDGLIVDKKLIKFDCTTAVFMSGSGECISDRAFSHAHRGDKAVAWWFKMPDYIFGGEHNFLLKITVNGEEILDIEDSKRIIARAKSGAILNFTLLSALFFFARLKLL